MGIAKWIYKDILGWKINGDFSQDTVKKAVIAAVPHTSWHDFYVGILLRTVLGVKIGFIGKKELFKWPLGPILRMMGGASLDRTPGQDKVKAIAKVFDNKDEFRITIAPEGTRKKVDTLKTGFYYIALTAGVPIIMVAFDFGKKEHRISKPLYPSGNIQADMKIINSFFKGAVGKVPEYSYTPEV
ncbi:1-acyl-sn-glycerol-3-phosphate acyltransferase [Dokdonia sp. Hel_I_53]|uniref:1-acyl-sn-glycerol-3-phosphate acyltransferase n=1 Tax=Dokdonia sp. Hel_I_53 TaxID=1566287 RepID=UPI00119A1713|nr:1-acyl-sn-glycerol-3-phosphate acyltransferase [Dokdonia sp. Hel_I_53]TVZ51326.1 1-acyl-sn-glycerol-3-phosphate acyltransferase [Dokdonia sp. Hel_I_53]